MSLYCNVNLGLLCFCSDWWVWF